VVNQTDEKLGLGDATSPALNHHHHHNHSKPCTGPAPASSRYRGMRGATGAKLRDSGGNLENEDQMLTNCCLAFALGCEQQGFWARRS